MPVWLKEKLYLKSLLKRELASWVDAKRRDYRRCASPNIIKLTPLRLFFPAPSNAPESCVSMASENGPLPRFGWARVIGCPPVGNRFSSFARPVVFRLYLLYGFQG